MNDYSYKSIISDKLPIYLHGAFSDYSNRVLDWLDNNDGKLTHVFDQSFLEAYNTDKHDSYISRYNELGLRVMPPPNYVETLPRGVVILAVNERNQRELWRKWGGGNYHRVIDVLDIINSSYYVHCSDINRNSSDLLNKCHSCPAALRHCAVRSEWYEREMGLTRDKVIRHLAFKAGVICNFKCKHCCEFLPHFSEKHRQKFDADRLIEDIKKLSESLEYIGVLSFSGGDVMLNKGLGKVIEETIKLNNIGDMYCLTNGTYIPSNEVLDAIQLSNGRVRVVINNYSINNGASPLTDELKKRNIIHNIRNNTGWFDFTDYGFKNRSVGTLKSFINTCAFDAGSRSKYYHIMIDGKISERCGVASGLLYYLDKWSELTQDYIDIRSLSVDCIPTALTNLEDRGYMDICNFCVSAATGENTLAAAEEQLKN
ncbi:MAG: radical SAM protein [Oscillospiraceae bacterium]|nr:radical SAM protein [Oscillospiraceae bacterium]